MTAGFMNRSAQFPRTLDVFLMGEWENPDDGCSPSPLFSQQKQHREVLFHLTNAVLSRIIQIVWKGRGVEIPLAPSFEARLPGRQSPFFDYHTLFEEI